MFAPILLVCGALICAPGVWGVMFLAGAVETEKEGADSMAKWMLATIPIGVIVIAGGVYCIVHHLRMKRRIAEEASAGA